MIGFHITEGTKLCFPELLALSEAGCGDWTEASKAYLAGLRRVTELLSNSASHNTWAKEYAPKRPSYDLFEETSDAIRNAIDLLHLMEVEPMSRVERARRAVFNANLWKFAYQEKLHFTQIRDRYHLARKRLGYMERRFVCHEFDKWMTGIWMPTGDDLEVLAHALGCIPSDLCPWLADDTAPD
jgi:hypothetical protein